MKNLKIKIITVIALCFAINVAQASSKRYERLIKAAEQIGMTEDMMSELRAACDDYDRADAKIKELSELHGLNKIKPQMRTVITADVRDPAIRQIEKEAKKYKDRYAVLKRTIKK